MWFSFHPPKCMVDERTDGLCNLAATLGGLSNP
jgi:hypothetical protein